MATQSLVSIGVQTSGLSQFTRAVKAADKNLARSLRAKLKTVGDKVAGRARSNASWSTRIPGSVKTSVTNRGVSVKAGGAKAPHAAAFEHGGVPGTFRHPVFGGAVWAEQQAHPFLLSALNVDEVDQAALAAVDAWLADCGFR